MRGPFTAEFHFTLSLVGCGDNTHRVQQSWELTWERIMYFQQCVNYGKADKQTLAARCCSLLAAQ